MILGTAVITVGIVIVLFWQVIAYFTKPGLGKNLLISAFILYLSLVAAVTLFPIPYQSDEIFGYKMNFIPLKTIISTVQTGDINSILLQNLGNIALCVPYGLMIPFMMKRRSLLKMLLLAPLLSVCIETIQLCIGLMLSPNELYRAIDIDDVLLNTVGTLLGYLIYRYFPQNLKAFFTGWEPISET